MTKKVALVILDGWGIGRHDNSDAVWKANTPFTDRLWAEKPHCKLRTDGENVGLPAGQMGNSEVGHMNIGAGRIVWQMLVRINKAFDDGSISDIPKFQQMLENCRMSGRPLHLTGLVSDGGVHSHINHLKGICKIASNAGVRVFVHAFLDGRDTDPKSGIGYLRDLSASLSGTNAALSTVVGRYYAMDRDKRWERVKKAYDLMVKGTGEFTADILDKINAKYEAGITDEFMEPVRCLPGSEGLIKDGDTVLCFNFRTDRGRQITEALSQKEFPEQGMTPLNLHYYTLTEYDETFKIDGVIFENQNLSQTLGEVLSEHGKTQLRAAETEKYPHVTFFFSGGREEEFNGETRLLVNSPKVATYDLQPEMSAFELTEKAIHLLHEQKPDFMVLNYANPDMVGHTGVFSAIVKACETVDANLQKLVAEGTSEGYSFIIIADHGNADFAVNDDGTPNTAHSTNPVPCWILDETVGSVVSDGILADVAPTVLKLMNVPQPQLMTGRSLV